MFDDTYTSETSIKYGRRVVSQLSCLLISRKHSSYIVGHTYRYISHSSTQNMPNTTHTTTYVKMSLKSIVD